MASSTTNPTSGLESKRLPTPTLTPIPTPTPTPTPTSSTTAPPPRKKPASPSPHITVSPARPADAPGIARLGARTFTETFGYSIPPDDLAAYLDATYTAELVAAELRDPDVSTFVARDETETQTETGTPAPVLGFVQLVRGISDPCLGNGEEEEEEGAASHAELRRLYVDSGAHGRGIGSRLIKAVEERARAEGFVMLWLTVWEDNPNAQRLYRRLGYEKAGEVDFVMAECVQTDWVMAKKLGGQ